MIFRKSVLSIKLKFRRKKLSVVFDHLNSWIVIKDFDSLSLNSFS